MSSRSHRPDAEVEDFETFDDRTPVYAYEQTLGYGNYSSVALKQFAKDTAARLNSKGKQPASDQHDADPASWDASRNRAGSTASNSGGGGGLAVAALFAPQDASGSGAAGVASSSSSGGRRADDALEMPLDPLNPDASVALDLHSSASGPLVRHGDPVPGTEVHTEEIDLRGDGSSADGGARSNKAADDLRALTTPQGIKAQLSYWVAAVFNNDWVFLALLGMLTSTIGFTVDLTIAQAEAGHRQLVHLTDDKFLQYLLWVSVTMGVMLFAVGFTHFVSTNAIGSGIPELKTILKGIDLYHYFSFRTLVAKIVGVAGAIGSGIQLGKEGPYVHIACILVHKGSKHLFKAIANNKARRLEMLSAACAVGVAVNFGVPIGGVLFAIEVTATYFAIRNYWRGFFVATVSALMNRVLVTWYTGSGVITPLYQTFFPKTSYQPIELLVFIPLGMLGGLIGSLFVKCHRKYIDFRRLKLNNISWIKNNWFMYPLIVTFVLATVTSGVVIGPYMNLTQRQVINNLFSQEPLVKVNPDWDYPNIFVALLIFAFVKFFFVIFAISLPVPAGMAFPVYVLGAALGRFVGEVIAVINPNPVEGWIPASYALVGATSCAAGVTHTIAIAIITFELTGQIHHVIPLLTAVVVSNAVAQSWMLLYNMTAADLMNRDLALVSEESTYADIKDLVSKTEFSTFPVVNSREAMILIGTIRRDVLQRMLNEQLSKALAGLGGRSRSHTLDGAVSDDEHHGDTFSSITSNVSFTGNETLPTDSTLPENERKKKLRKRRMPSFVNIFRKSVENVDAPVEAQPDEREKNALERRIHSLLDEQVVLRGARIDASPFQLVARTSLAKVHSLFSLLGLNVAIVTSRGRVVGVITMRELNAAIEGASAKP
ncbi:voltage-gated chloride channel protein [Capsaspora owczarzaki ATCC 30864]|uniref:voltage-gated chloride channel protein n=1 Tax=Capsaspora owczarzaki (strain ATCC 30864) TaxID=595528 RepID=UPI0001FE2710|nr:voltage-gated chloride channel protein [Capsaspora owczarzaki ATCC 30864]|eukprot:XP_004346666.1 voltage-gated chloride channel protein [Capsaspora owczarzaki ATCC 30864]